MNLKQLKVMRIDDSKLPIKYALGVFQKLPGYPSHQDLEYNLLRYLEERDHLGKPFKPEQLWHGFKNWVPTMNDLKGFLDYLSTPDDPADKQSFIIDLIKHSDGTYQIQSHSWM